MQAHRDSFVAPPVDPRVLMARVERGLQAITSTAIGSPPWICITALLASSFVGLFGDADLTRAMGCVATIFSASLIVRVTVHQFSRDRALNVTAARAQRLLVWVTRLDVLMSAAWGSVSWWLWQPGNLANHLFITLMSFAVVVRFLVTRAGHWRLFLASFGPMAALLCMRLIVEFQTADLVMAGLVPLYALYLGLDVRHHFNRFDADEQLRFANEDMTRELEEAHEEALHKRAEAEVANASKTAFLANMSHELRTPLNAILGFSEIIARECLGPAGSPRYKEYAGDIHNSGAHLLSLINDLLDIAKIESGKMEIDPSAIETKCMLESALKLVAVRARERRQTLSITVSEDAEILFADERALKQIVINLASNAVKFTPEGGRITVSARCNGKGDFELLIEDNGPGIPKEKLAQIFKPFSQLDNRYDRKGGGTGLGLALVRGLAELHDGRAWIESDAKTGTRAFVAFPMRSDAVKRRA